MCNGGGVSAWKGGAKRPGERGGQLSHGNCSSLKGCGGGACREGALLQAQGVVCTEGIPAVPAPRGLQSTQGCRGGRRKERRCRRRLSPALLPPPVRDCAASGGGTSSCPLGYGRCPEAAGGPGPGHRCAPFPWAAAAGRATRLGATDPPHTHTRTSARGRLPGRTPARLTPTPPPLFRRGRQRHRPRRLRSPGPGGRGGGRRRPGRCGGGRDAAGAARGGAPGAGGRRGQCRERRGPDGRSAGGAPRARASETEAAGLVAAAREQAAPGKCEAFLPDGDAARCWRSCRSTRCSGGGRGAAAAAAFRRSERGIESRVSRALGGRGETPLESISRPGVGGARALLSPS